MSAAIVHEPFDLNKQHENKTTLTNVLKLLAGLGERIRFDEMRGRIVCADIKDYGHMPDGIWTDTHTIALVAVCEASGLEASKATVQDAVVLFAKRNSFNGLRDWLVQAAERWDGELRVDRALIDYWGAADNAASIATARIFLLSLAARGLEPGCKVDTCPIFIGAQGTFKSTALAVLAGGPDYFGDSPLPIGDKDALEVIRGKWVWEIGENAGMSARDQNKVKAFMSASHDSFRASYGRFSEDVPRTCVFAATSNENEVLHDATGARRNMPIEVTRIDIDGLRRDREQLLGEAAFRVIQEEQHWPTPAEDVALESVRSEHTDSDPWEELIAVWLDRRAKLHTAEAAAAALENLPTKFRRAALENLPTKFRRKPAPQVIPGEPPPFTLTELFAAEDTDSHGQPIKFSGGAVPLKPAQVGKREYARAAAVLRRLGYVRGKQERIDGVPQRRWRLSPV